jgi:hypothetical protein
MPTTYEKAVQDYHDGGPFTALLMDSHHRSSGPIYTQQIQLKKFKNK